MALLFVVTALATLTGPDPGRTFLIIPVTALISLLAFAGLPALRITLPGITLASLALFLGYLLFSTLFFHSEIVTRGLLQGIILLGMTFSIALLACAYRPSDPAVPRILNHALQAGTLLIAGGIIFSYFSGWGEVFETRDGIRRAYGFATDSVSAPLVFFLLFSLNRQQILPVILVMTALFMSGGKMGLGLAAAGTLLTTVAMRRRRDHRWMRTALIALLGIAVGVTLTDPRLGHLLFARMPAPITAPAAPASNPGTALINETPVPQPDIPAPADPQTRTTTLHYLAASSLATGIGRLITWGAGLGMVADHPLTGVGFQQSKRPDIFQHYAQADILQLRQHFGVTSTRIGFETDPTNQMLTFAAELGLPGALLFGLFCLCCLWLAACILRQPDNDPLLTAAAGWIMLIILFNQTAPWFIAGSTPLTLFAAALSVCVAGYRPR